jgi:putative hydrolase of HD superfamily
MKAKKFKYAIPKLDSKISGIATMLLELGALAEQLTIEERFLVDHASGRAENDAEHAHMLSRIAPIIALNYYPELNAGLTSLYATIHDDVEAYVGDTPTHEYKKEILTDKKNREKHGLEQLFKEYAHIPTYTDLIFTYEAQDVPEARFVRLLDKLMPVIMHFSDKGVNLNKHWTKAEFEHHANAKTDRIRVEYPEFEKLLNARAELITYVSENFYN